MGIGSGSGDGDGDGYGSGYGNGLVSLDWLSGSGVTIVDHESYLVALDWAMEQGLDCEVES